MEEAFSHPRVGGGAHEVGGASGIFRHQLLIDIAYSVIIIYNTSFDVELKEGIQPAGLGIEPVVRCLLEIDGRYKALLEFPYVQVICLFL